MGDARADDGGHVERMIDILNKGIFDALAASSAVTSLLAAGSASLYFGQAPKGAAKSYVVYTLAAGGDDHLTPQESGDVMYYIHGIDKSPTKAGQIAAAIRATLHEKETAFNLTSPWKMYRSQADAIIAYTETIDSVEFWHMGNSYRFRLSQ
jgi:hypothetical protein